MKIEKQEKHMYFWITPYPFSRLPDSEAATALRKAIESGASNLKERLFIQLGRHCLGIYRLYKKS